MSLNRDCSASVSIYKVSFINFDQIFSNGLNFRNLFGNPEMLGGVGGLQKISISSKGYMYNHIRDLEAINSTLDNKS